MCPTTQRWLIEAQHAPADRVAIAAVARRAIIALHGVLADEFEECAILFFNCEGNLELLCRGRVAESIAAAIAAQGISLFESSAVGVLMATVVARELAIDVGDDAGLRGARKLVGGNDLIAESGENAGLGVAEEIPRGAGTPVASDDSHGAAESARHSELPPG